jgi:hypothetical protein
MSLTELREPEVRMGFARSSDAAGGADRLKPIQTGGELREPEVRMGFEPTSDGFANHCLTTWLPHRSKG